jgi:radical SAM protein with 4Fe4S-binding SPASM domain
MEQIYFVLTDRCNLQCSHCIRESSPWREEAVDPDLMTKVLGTIARDFPDATVLLSGGEPTVYRQFAPILQRAMDLQLDIIVNSNGTTSFYKTSNLSSLAHYRKLSFQISLDGIEPRHNAVRGEGSYRRALHSVQRLIASGIRTSVSATAIDLAFVQEAEAFVQGLDSLGLNHIAIKRVTYAGRASHGSSLDTESWNKEVYRLRALPLRTPLVINPMYDFARLDNIDDATLEQLKPSSAAVNCGAGVAKAYVYPNGDVCACTCFRDLPIGNLHGASLQAILAKHNPLQVKDTGCSSCRYLALCRGGCLGSGYQHGKVLGKADPRCPRTAAAPARSTFVPIQAI